MSHAKTVPTRLMLFLTVVVSTTKFGVVNAADMTNGAIGSAPVAIHLQNTSRTGYTARELKPPFHLAWTYRARHKPRPAWREPVWETQRIDFDYAYAIAAGNGLVYVASSSEHAIEALDLESGRPRWRFFTEGPMRLAPAVAAGKIYAASDDGVVYCLDGTTGQLVWKHRPAIAFGPARRPRRGSPVRSPTIFPSRTMWPVEQTLCWRPVAYATATA